MNKLEQFIEKLKKDTDFTGLINTLDQIEKPEIIPFNIPSLDKILGIGGIPRGMLTEIYGNESTCKSSICLRLVGQAQKMGVKCGYLDAEMALGQGFAETMGVDNKNLIVARPLNGEEAFELIEAMSESGHGLIIVDSVSSLTPEDELEADFDQQSMALQARLMSKGMRKIVGCINRNNTAVVFINQVRDDIGKVGFGEKTTTSGGRALKFYAALRIKMTRTGWIKEGEEKIGMSLKVVTAKNKLATPQRETNIDFYFSTGFDIDSDKLNVMLEEKQIELIGRTYFTNNGEKIGDKQKVLEYIKNNK